MNKTQKLLLLFLTLIATGFNRISAQQWDGYTLYSVQNSSTTYLIDTNSNTYHTWTHATTAKTGYSSYLMPGGILWRTVTNTGNSISGGGVTGRVQKVAYDGTVLWDYTYSGSTYVLHHDICPLPNGNVLLISYDVKTSAEAVQAGCSQSISIRSEKIMEVQPTGATTGTVVWEWKLWDHLVQNYNSSKDNYATSVLDHPELLDINYDTQNDWIHMNGIDYNPVLDQIALSSHNLNQWFIIDHSTTTAQAAVHTGGNAGKGGDFLYRYGNPSSYDASGSTVLNVTHDSHWLQEGIPNAGRLVGFNNKGISNTQSCVDQIDVPRVNYNYSYTAGSAYSPTTYTVRTACNGVSTNMGSSEQYPNGNQLICMATQGTMYEINSAGTVLWTKTASGTVPQAHRYSLCYISNAAPSIPTISVSNGTLSSTSATTYQWYLNGDAISGATSQTYTPTASGKYVVRITDANGCVYQYSLGYSVTLPDTPAISANGATALCSGGTVTLTSSTGTSYLWSNGATTQSITVSSAGSYSVTVTNASGFSATSAATVVTAGATPATPVIMANGSTAICDGTSLILTSSQEDSYAWSSGETTQSISVTAAGSYSVTVTNAEGCSATSASVNVTVIDAPVIASGTVTEPSACGVADGSVIISGSETGDLTWTGSAAGSLSGVTLPETLSGLSAGVYNVVFINGSCSSNTVTITISDPNAPTVNAGSDQEVCEGTSIVLSGSGALTYTWDSGITDGVAFTPASTATYIVTGTDASGCQGSDQVTVIVHPNPDVSMTEPDDVCTNSVAFTLTEGSPAGGTYSGTGVDSGSFDPAVSGAGTFSITYFYEDGNGCSASAVSAITVEECLGLNENEATVVYLYPNPVKNILKIESSNGFSMIQLFDNLGKQVLIYQLNEPETSIQLDLSGIAIGVYRICITGTNNFFMQQSVVIQN